MARQRPTPGPASPLSIDVRDLPRRAGSLREVTLAVANPAQMGGGVIVVAAGEPLQIEARLESVVEGVLVTAEVDTEMSGECGYCLEPVRGPIQVDVQQLFAYPGAPSSADPDELDVALLQDDHADLGPAVTDAVGLALPFSRLCDDDCPRLAQTRAVLAAEEPVDPRWAGLADLRGQLDEG